jgi:hypothetical protein
MKIALVTIVIFLVNLVFGYWRANTRKFSLQWIGAIHIPVPIAIGLRLWLLGWNWFLLPVFVIDFAVGQYSGGRTRGVIEKRFSMQPGSWLIGDLFRLRRGREKATADTD